MVFVNVKVCRDAMKFYEIKHGRKMDWRKNDKMKIYIVCLNGNGFKWIMRAHMQDGGETFRIIKYCYESNHKCDRKYDVKHISSSFVAREMLGIEIIL